MASAGLCAMATVLLLVSGVVAEPACHLVEIQQCVTSGLDWLKTLPRGSMAETEEDARSLCETLDASFACATAFRDKCMTPIQKELVKLLQDGSVSLKEEFCRPGSDVRTKYLSHATCINKVSRSDETREDIEYILATLERLMSVPDKDKIHYTCCGYKKMLNSIRGRLRDTCGEDAVLTVGDMISTVTAQLPAVLCNDVEGAEQRCAALLPPPGTKASEGAKGTALFQYVQDALKNWLD